jgi:tetratricopeptide (TPR) repeat protein
VRALAALAALSHYGPDRERGLRESARALDLARRSGRADLLVAALLGRLQVTWLPGHEDELAGAAEELLALVGEDERPEVVALALSRRDVARLIRGDLDGDGGDDLARAWDVAERAGLPLVQAQLVSLQAARAALFGDFELALELTDRAVALHQRTQLYAQAAQDVAMRASVWIHQGCAAERLAGIPPVPPVRGTVLITALALLEAGQPAAAAEAMAAADGFAPYPLQWDAVALGCWQALVAAGLAATGGIDPAVPAAIADRLLPHAGRLAVQGAVGALGPVGVFLGLAEAAAGRTDDAERHLREAVATASRLGLRPSLARGHLALAELLVGRGDPAAASHAAEALRLAEEVGMRLVAQQAAELASGGSTGGHVRPLRWAGTTRV